MPALRPLITSILLSLFVTGCAALQGKIDGHSVRLQIVDEAGQPVPYAYVWSNTEPCIGSKPEAACLTGEAMKRGARGLGQTAYLSLPANRPYSLAILPMSDANGMVEMSSNFTGGPYGKPSDKLTVSVVAFKRGYLPGLRVTQIKPFNTTVKGQLVLPPDPDLKPDTADYAKQIDRLWYELSDNNKTNAIAVSTQVRLSRIRNELISAAQQAEAAGDRQNAARAYFRLAFMPSVRPAKPNSGIIVAGYTNPNATDAMQSPYMDEVKRLIPDNPWIEDRAFMARAQTTPRLLSLRENADVLSESERQDMRAFIQERIQWADENFDSLWTEQLARFVYSLVSRGMPEQAYQRSQKMHASGLHDQVANDLLKPLKGQCEHIGKPLPKEWQQLKSGDQIVEQWPV